MAAELTQPEEQSSIQEGQVLLSSANVIVWNGKALSIETGAKGILYGTRHVYRLDNDQSVVIWKAINANPQITMDQLVRDSSLPIASALEQEREQMAFSRSPEGEAFYARLRRRDGGFIPSYPMTELVAASGGDPREIIRIGNYHEVVRYALHMCASYNILSSAEDVTQHFMVEIMPDVIRKFDPDRGSFVTFIALKMKNLMGDLVKSKPLQARVLSSMRNSISITTSKPDDRNVLDELQIDEDEAITREAQLMLEEEDPYAKRLVDLCESVGMNERETRAFVLKYWLEKSSKEIGSVLDLSKGAVDTIMWRLRDRLGSEGEDTVAARIWRNAI